MTKLGEFKLEELSDDQLKSDYISLFNQLETSNRYKLVDENLLDLMLELKMECEFRGLI